MWIKILETDIGPQGTFIKGEIRNVGDEVVKELPKNIYQETLPPWERSRDQLTISIEAAESEFKKLQAEANVALDLQQTTLQKAKEYDVRVARLEQVVRQSKKSAKKIAELQLSKAQGCQKAAWADAELKDIEFTAAGQAADKAYAKLRTLLTKKSQRDAPQVEPPPADQTETETVESPPENDDVESQSEQPDKTEPPAEDQPKNNNDTEGQTTKAG